MIQSITTISFNGLTITCHRQEGKHNPKIANETKSEIESYLKNTQESLDDMQSIAERLKTMDRMVEVTVLKGKSGMKMT